MVSHNQRNSRCTQAKCERNFITEIGQHFMQRKRVFDVVGPYPILIISTS